MCIYINTGKGSGGPKGIPQIPMAAAGGFSRFC